ncbi:SDR family NAD(P)-dependent oxidoreductase [Mycobacterium hubeiense]|uniref:SDR family NAD(P)-dependent oxidoreductase n=1 Tax=Mycobacterium hubeiense TaxID=1867256 RepID=UPI000C7F4CA1|nr:SDR family NAD(P)-dependent oxidoreductase [Mycobacterium sp. QGD 101]
MTRAYPEIPLTGAVVAVTGAARGIGLATAQRFAKRGARVAIGDLDGAAATDAAGAIGPQARGYQVNVTERDSFEEFVDAAERDLGAVDVLVNNAGIMPIGPFLDEREEVSATTFDVNVFAHMHAARILAPRMIRRGRGHIVNVTSAAGRLHSPGLATYTASKHAALAFSRSLREEIRPHGVSVTAVLPSAVNTQLVDGIPLGFIRFGVIPPSMVARRIVATVRSRPPLAGAPIGMTPLLAAANLVPERLWLLGRRIVNADRTMGPIDRDARAQYDARIDANLRAAP